MTVTPSNTNSSLSSNSLSDVRSALSQRVLGQEAVIDASLATLLAGGHLLLEGSPGVGKTSLARDLAQSFGGEFSRVQMTSDLLPSEIIGLLKPTADGRDFEFRRGPIFSSFLLTDELNRTNPKTQAALLEAMAEKQVTVDGVSYPLPEPFFVVATQNPMDFQGVFALPESQLDRFMLYLKMEPPAKELELSIYKKGASPHGTIDAKATLKELKKLQSQVETIHLEDSVTEYIYELIHHTRTHSEVETGVSVRGGLQLIRAAQGMAFLRNRDFVTPTDVQDLAVAALAHRLRLSDHQTDYCQKRSVIETILSTVKAPR